MACSSGETVKGIDVSVYEASIDWTKVKAAGVDYAFIRASDGLQYIDPAFPGYWAGAKAAGVIRGAYQYFRPAEDPVAQADLLLSKISPIEPGDLPPVLDLEVSGGLTQAQVMTSVHAWVDHITAAIGRPPIIYAGLYSWPTLTGGADMTTSPLWVAQYTSAACPDIPDPWTQWLFWQDSSTGSVDGIPGATLDVDLFAGTLADLQGFTFGGTAPTCAPIAATGGEIDNGDPCFVSGGPSAYLRSVTTAGEDGNLVWTHATAEATEANFADWNLSVAAAGRYEVDVYTAQPWAQSKQAAYLVDAGGAQTSVTIDQSAADGWQTLGEFDFAQGSGQSIHLVDNTGEASTDNIQLVFDAIRLVPVPGPTPPTPPPPPEMASGCATTSSSSWLVEIGRASCRERVLRLV